MLFASWNTVVSSPSRLSFSPLDFWNGTGAGVVVVRTAQQNRLSTDRLTDSQVLVADTFPVGRIDRRERGTGKNDELQDMHGAVVAAADDDVSA